MDWCSLSRCRAPLAWRTEAQQVSWIGRPQQCCGLLFCGCRRRDAKTDDTIYCVWPVGGSRRFFHSRQQDKHRFFHSEKLIHNPFCTLSTGEEIKISENPTRKMCGFHQLFQKARFPLTERCSSGKIYSTGTRYGAKIQRKLRNFVIAARRFLYERGKRIYDSADRQTRWAQSAF